MLVKNNVCSLHITLTCHLGYLTAFIGKKETNKNEAVYTNLFKSQYARLLCSSAVMLTVIPQMERCIT